MLYSPITRVNSRSQASGSERNAVSGILLPDLPVRQRGKAGHAHPGCRIEHLVDDSDAFNEVCLQHRQEGTTIVGGKRNERAAPPMVTNPIVMNAAEEAKILLVGLFDVIGLGEGA